MVFLCEFNVEFMDRIMFFLEFVMDEDYGILCIICYVVEVIWSFLNLSVLDWFEVVCGFLLVGFYF